ncbi:MAG: nitroreductase family protein, partial [Thermodesulfobacteriota bacterium]
MKQPKIVLLNRKIGQPDTHLPSSPIPHPIFCGQNSIDTQDPSLYTPAVKKQCLINYQLDRALLADLVKIGATAPSGTNSQMWTFTILPARESVTALGDQVAMFFKRINNLSEIYWLRNALRFIGKPELDHYYRDYHQSVSEALTERENSGEDRLFHGATAAIVVGSRPEGSTLKEDALLATQNILLAAHSMGLGTCLIGFAVIPMMKDI